MGVPRMESRGTIWYLRETGLQKLDIAQQAAMGDFVTTSASPAPESGI